MFESVERKSRRVHESHLDAEINQIKIMELNYEKEELLKGINQEITNFDNEIIIL